MELIRRPLLVHLNENMIQILFCRQDLLIALEDGLHHDINLSLC